jgi:hypothetical protein
MNSVLLLELRFSYTLMKETSAKQGRDRAPVQNMFLVHTTVDDDDDINKVFNTRGLRQGHVNSW